MSSYLTSLYAKDVSCLPFTVTWNPSKPTHNVAVKGVPSTKGKLTVPWSLPLETLVNMSLLGRLVFRFSSEVLLTTCSLQRTSPSTVELTKLC